MDNMAQVFLSGDWIFHRNYGIGQVVGVEKKRINQKKKRFYKVRTKNSTYWLAVDAAENSRVGPLPSLKMIEQALAVLRTAPREMSNDFKERQNRIKVVNLEGSFLVSAELVRDLAARRSESQLNSTEQNALERLTNRILEIWSIRTGIDKTEARRKLLRWVTDDKNN